MRNILMTLATACVAALIASSASAACSDKHQQVMASTPQEKTTIDSQVQPQADASTCC